MKRASYILFFLVSVTCMGQSLNDMQLLAQQQASGGVANLYDSDDAANPDNEQNADDSWFSASVSNIALSVSTDAQNGSYSIQSETLTTANQRIRVQVPKSGNLPAGDYTVTFYVKMDHSTNVSNLISNGRVIVDWGPSTNITLLPADITYALKTVNFTSDGSAKFEISCWPNWDGTNPIGSRILIDNIVLTEN